MEPITPGTICGELIVLEIKQFIIGRPVAVCRCLSEISGQVCGKIRETQLGRFHCADPNQRPKRCMDCNKIFYYRKEVKRRDERRKAGKIGGGVTVAMAKAAPPAYPLQEPVCECKPRHYDGIDWDVINECPLHDLFPLTKYTERRGIGMAI